MAPPNADAENPGLEQAKTLETQLKAEVTKMISLVENLKSATLAIVGGAESLNKSFLQSRQRISEFTDSINSALPRMNALGAEAKDVYETIAQIAVGSRRQVVAATQDLVDVYAAAAVTGSKVSDLVEKFGQVGYNYQEIASNVLRSVEVINSIGANARVVMGDVLKNTEQLQRFNFEKGVQGLTRMAAQASLLRFDMNQTFQLADKVLDPDQAVSVASAFQRLGVAAGNLVDPMALLNQSLTDPSGLQDSLINVAKQFTYFDEQTKSFKINPQGILTLREMESQTGVSAKSMRDAAIAAADLDKRLGEINKLGIANQFSQEDKELLANISRFDKEGQIEVRVKDSQTGVESYKKLTDATLTFEEIEKTLKAQKEGPQTIEELQRAQLGTGELTLAELRKLNSTIAQSIIGTPYYMNQLLKSTEDVRGTFGNLTQNLFNPEFQRRFATKQEEIEKERDPAEKKRKMDEFQKELGDFLPVLKDNLLTEMGTLTTGTFGKNFVDEYLGDLGIQSVLGKKQKVSGIGGIIQTPLPPQQRTSERSRSIFGSYPSGGNTIDLSDLLGRVSAARGPQEVKVNFGPWNPTIQVKGIPEGYDQTAFNRVIDEMTRQTAEKLKSKIEGVQQTLV